MKALVCVAALLAARPDEKALREEFTKEIQSKEAAQRVKAVKKLTGVKEEETIRLLAGHLNDSAKEVLLAVAEALQAADDEAGVGVKPLGALLVDKKSDPEVRLACAKALGKSKYKVGPLGALIETICNIKPEDGRVLHKFGADVVQILNDLTGEDFGKGKTTPDRWEEWWKDNKARLQKEDDARLADYKKGQKN